MKCLILCLGFLTTNAFAQVSNVNITKSPDGKTVNCSTDAEIGRTGYRPLITTLQAAGTDLKFNTGIASVVCAKKNDQLAFDGIAIGSPSHGRDSENQPTLETFSQLKFIVINTGYEVIAQSNATSEILQILDYSIPLTTALSPAELARLKNGEIVHARWEFFLQGIHSIRTRHETIPLGIFTGGSFYLNFDLIQNSSGAIEVHNFRLN